MQERNNQSLSVLQSDSLSISHPISPGEDMGNLDVGLTVLEEMSDSFPVVISCYSKHPLFSKPT
jgi:hypothetical protein